jgi:hypothetical protein
MDKRQHIDLLVDVTSFRQALILDDQVFVNLPNFGVGKNF